MVTATELYDFVKYGMGNSGQLSATNIIGFVILIVVLASTMPTITTFINITKNSTGAETDIILDLLPLFLVRGVVMTLFMYARPHYE